MKLLIWWLFTEVAAADTAYFKHLHSCEFKKLKYFEHMGKYYQERDFIVILFIVWTRQKSENLTIKRTFP